MCLSYCWGGPQPLVCTRDKLEPCGQWKIVIDHLPATFRDTIRVTRDLGYRYLWIDSLCIAQDDAEDVEREIRQMAPIYKNAALTICASTVQSCKYSFLQPRPDMSQQQIRLSMPGKRQGTLYLDSHDWFQTPVAEPLRTRAWAFQERLLSPRLLEYGWRTVRWTCWCQDGYNGNQHLSHASKTRQPIEYSMYPYLTPFAIRRLPRTRESLLKGWAMIVRHYTSKKLTEANDRLAAISGIARELSDVIGIPYFAGLWNYEKLPTLLQWRVMVAPATLRSRPEARQAPSWSWAAVDDAVSIHLSEDVVPKFKVLATRVSGGFGSRASGSITVQGPMRCGIWWSRNLTSVIETDAAGNLRVPNAVEGLIIWPDCAGEFVHLDGDCVWPIQVELVFMAIGRANYDHSRVRGLILKKTEHHYMRVGLFHGLYDVIQKWEVGSLGIE